MSTADSTDVCVVGGGPAGLTAGLFTARAGLDTVLVDAGDPILERNAHLENVPGFPVGVNSRLFLDMLREQADRNGVHRRDDHVARVEQADDGLVVVSDGGDRLTADWVICTSWADTDYLAGLEAVGIAERGSKTYVEVTDDGWTGVPGLYAAGRIAGTRHQTVVAAGDGADVALAVVEASDVPFYHDWVVPEGYFTERDREVPPGCAEIDDGKRRQREAESRAVMREYFADPHPDDPTQHPSVRE
jgi:thioredoxin reductase